MNERDDSVSLKEWTQELNEATRDRISALEKHIEKLFEASQRAVDTAAEAMTIRLDHANGLIKQMKDRELQYASNAAVDALDARLSQLEQFRSNLEGAQSGNKPVDALDARLSMLEQVRANVEGTKLGSKPMRDLAMVVAGALLSYIATKLLA